MSEPSYGAVSGREADAPPVCRWADLPEPLDRLARTGFEAWQGGLFDDAERSLSELRDLAAGRDDRSGSFHALHLLACVAFSRGSLQESRRLHEQVLGMSQDIGFSGGAASSLFDLAMIDQQEGDIASAHQNLTAAREAFEAGGYDDRIGIVERALASLPPS